MFSLTKYILLYFLHKNLINYQSVVYIPWIWMFWFLCSEVWVFLYYLSQVWSIFLELWTCLMRMNNSPSNYPCKITSVTERHTETQEQNTPTNLILGWNCNPCVRTQVLILSIFMDLKDKWENFHLKILPEEVRFN